MESWQSQCRQRFLLEGCRQQVGSWRSRLGRPGQCSCNLFCLESVIVFFLLHFVWINFMWMFSQFCEARERTPSDGNFGGGSTAVNTHPGSRRQPNSGPVWTLVCWWFSLLLRPSSADCLCMLYHFEMLHASAWMPHSYTDCWVYYAEVNSTGFTRFLRTSWTKT